MKAQSTKLVWCLAGLLGTTACIRAQGRSDIDHPQSSAQSLTFPASPAGGSEYTPSGDVHFPPQNAMTSQPSQSGSPSPAARGSETGLVGIGVTLSTLGIGFQAGVSIAPTLNVRGGASFFSYGRTFHYEGIDYKGNLDFRNGDLLLDWFPFHNGFHLSGGALIYNGNNVNATANAPGGQQFTLGSNTYYSSNTNPIAGTGKLQFRKAAPEIRFGVGNLVPRTKHVSFGFEVGVAFMGKPQTKLALNGSACLDATQINCLDAATNPTIQSNIISQQNKINDKARYAQYWPILAIGFGYRF